MRVVIGMSGGVDSSVAAYLLKQAGHEVIALFMRNWKDNVGTLSGDCTWEEDMELAQLSARRLDIPFHFVDLSEQYRQRVVEYMFSEYEKGRTPNPDVLCNREIKYDAFLAEAKKLGAEKVATGHYCRVSESTDADGHTVYSLLAGADGNKDQSYFLCQLTQEQLKYAMFPIGHLTKPEVRRIASELQLPTATRKDSQGICFVGKVDLPVFLQQKLKSEEGIVVEVPREFYQRTKQIHQPDESLQQLAQPYKYTRYAGKTIGKHIGAQFYTIGQRRGLNIGGHKEPLFVIATDVKDNIIYLGEGEHPGLYRPALFIRLDEIHWANPADAMLPGEQRDYLVRIRYRQPLQEARLHMCPEGLYIVFREAQRGITPGQFAAWYEPVEGLSGTTRDTQCACIGSGVINQ